jgi:hypothetical protein
MIDKDPAGFLLWLKSTGEQALSSGDKDNSVNMLLLKKARSILDRIEISGQFNNPQAREALKGVYTPEYLRFVTKHALTELSNCDVKSAVALCFIFHPAETLRELAFLGKQAFTSTLRDKMVADASSAIITACLSVPSLWSYLEPSSRKIMTGGPDKFQFLFRDVQLSDFIKFPAEIAEFCLRSYKSKDLEGDLLSLITDIERNIPSLLGCPGLAAVLKFCKQNVPDTHLKDLARKTRNQLPTQTYCDYNQNITDWILRQRYGEPRRSFSAARCILRELYVVTAPEGQEDIAAQEFERDFQARQNDRSQLLKEARAKCYEVFTRTSFLRAGDRDKVIDELPSYSSWQLEALLQVALGQKEGLNGRPTAPSAAASLLRLFGSDVLPPTADRAPFIQSLIEKSDGGAGYTVLFELLFKKYPEDTTRAILMTNQHSRGGQVFQIPQSDKLPYESLNRALLLWLGQVVVCHSLGDDLKLIIKDKIRSGEPAKTDRYFAALAKVIARNNIGVGDEKISQEIFSTLSKLDIREAGIAEWRENFLRAYLNKHSVHLHEFALFYSDTELFCSRYGGMLLGEHRMVPLNRDEMERARGTRQFFCYLNIARAPQGKLNSAEKKLYDGVKDLLQLTMSEWQQPVGLFKKVSLRDCSRHLTDLRQQAREILSKKPDSEVATKAIKLTRMYKIASDREFTYARLLRKLAVKQLISFHAEQASEAQYSKALLNRYGVEDPYQTQTLEFPVASFIKRFGLAAYREPKTPELRIINTSQAEFDELIRGCQRLIRIDLPFSRPVNFSRLMTLKHERHNFIQKAGISLLGLSALLASGATIRQTIKGLSAGGGHESSSLLVDPESELGTNGSIPKTQELVAHLSEPLSQDPTDVYLISSLHGASSLSAKQPQLSSGEQLAVAIIMQEMIVAPRGNTATLHFDAASSSHKLPLPLGGSKEFSSSLNLDEPIYSLSFNLDVKSNLNFRLSIPKPVEFDHRASARSCQELLLSNAKGLFTPRVDLSVIGTASPKLAQAIKEARRMTAWDAAEYLRGEVSQIIAYKESPDYDDFKGSFKEYIQTILPNRRGVCGQFAVIYDECLKQVGIPSCLVSVFAPEADGVRYLASGRHATNMVFIPDTSGNLRAKILDATGTLTEESDLEQGASVSQRVISPLTSPGVLGVTGGALSLLLLRHLIKRRERLENDAVKSAYNEQESPAEPPANTGKQDSALGDDQHGQTEMFLTRQMTKEIARRWFDRLYNDLVLSLPHAEGGDWDISYEKLAEQRAALGNKLVNIRKETRRIISAINLTGEASTDLAVRNDTVFNAVNEDLIVVVNSWLEAMKVSEYRKKWISSVKDHKDLDTKVKDSLLSLINESTAPKRSGVISWIFGKKRQEMLDLGLFLRFARP